MLVGDLLSLGTRLVEATGSAVNQSNASFWYVLFGLPCLTCHTDALTQQAAWTLRAFAHTGRDCLFSFIPASLLAFWRARFFLLIFEERVKTCSKQVITYTWYTDWCNIRQKGFSTTMDGDGTDS